MNELEKITKKVKPETPTRKKSAGSLQRDNQKKKIERALKKVGLYDSSIGIQVDNLTDTLMSLATVNKYLRELDSPVLVNKSSQGQTTVANPAFKVQKDLLTLVTQQMKQLGLYPENIKGEPEVRNALDDIRDEIESIN